MPDKIETTSLNSRSPFDSSNFIDNNPIAEVLIQRGVKFPLNGFAQGLYISKCKTCGNSHMADKRSMTCLPCAIVSGLDQSKNAVEARRQEGVLEGIRQSARFLNEQARLLDSNDQPVAPFTS